MKFGPPATSCVRLFVHSGVPYPMMRTLPSLEMFRLLHLTNPLFPKIETGPTPAHWYNSVMELPNAGPDSILLEGILVCVCFPFTRYI